MSVGPPTPPGDSYGIVAAGWVLEGNVRPFLEMVSHVVDYDFDDSDWSAISLALPATDDERPDGWYSYPLAGRRHEVEVGLAQDVQSFVVMVRVHGPADERLRESIRLLLAVFDHYEVKPRVPDRR